MLIFSLLIAFLFNFILKINFFLVQVTYHLPGRPQSLLQSHLGRIKHSETQQKLLMMTFFFYEELTHHARFACFLSVLHQLFQTELFLQLLLQIVLKALLICSASRPDAKQETVTINKIHASNFYK